MSAGLKVIAAVGVFVFGSFVATAALMMAALVGGDADERRTATPSFGFSACALSASSARVADLDAEQISNARTIVAIGKDLDVPPRGWVIAIATALQESGLRNLDYGDRDSLGMMQQRPSTGWGTATQVQDPSYAARAFFGGPSSPTPNAGLLSVDGWEQLPLWEAAQTVQRSAFPMAYADHEPLATEIVERLSGATAGCTPLRKGAWGAPVDGEYVLTSRYGWRTSPTRGGADFHTGQDFARPEGTSVRAVADGVVVSADWAGSYGNLVRVRHANGVESWYAHLASLEVTVGDNVGAGDQVGEVGSTGNSTGPHLHLEVRIDDRPTDPMPWLARKGVRM